MLRNLMLRMADNPSIAGFLARQGMRTGFAKRFIAGETFDEAIEAVRALNAEGIKASVDFLGEGVRDANEARAATRQYVDLLSTIRKSGVDSSVSIKLTQLGLGVDRGVCAENLTAILERARSVDNFVRIDMESSEFTHDTVELFAEVFQLFGRHVGIVIQSYLRRSQDDVRRLAEMGANVRLCKGAYKEPADIAFPLKSDVDANYIRLMEILLQSAAYTAIATHDDRMISHAMRFVEERQVAPEKYEFQMLYGIRPQEQRKIHGQGYKMRVYVPFGDQWAPYFLRRLAERPANVLFVLRNSMRR